MCRNSAVYAKCCFVLLFIFTVPLSYINWFLSLFVWVNHRVALKSACVILTCLLGNLSKQVPAEEKVGRIPGLSHLWIPGYEDCIYHQFDSIKRVSIDMDERRDFQE